MKYVFLLLTLLFINIPSYAFSLCELCKANQPEGLENITHGNGPEGNIDYFIMYGAIIIVGYTLFMSVKYLAFPREKKDDHIKNIVVKKKNKHLMKKKREVTVFLDDEKVPFGVFEPPAKLVLDTTKISDGKHTLKITATSSSGVQGVRTIPFEVRNGPEISVIGLKDNEIIEANTAITINAYGNEAVESFVITGSETPKAIPSWVWALLIGFVAFALFYFITYWTITNYKSFF